jgi:hypothetical protein
MNSDLADRYNEGIVPPPDLPEDIPKLRRPSDPAALGEGTPNRALWVATLLVVAVLLIACVLLATWAVSLMRGM